MRIEQEQGVVQILKNTDGLHRALEAISVKTEQQHSFYLADLGEVVMKYQTWKQYLPTVQPFYSVKCNDSPAVLQLLASLGCGFNCLSKGEISKVMELGVEPERILFGNPVKMASQIKYAARFGVDLMTFDSVSELHKIKAYHTSPKLVLRLALKQQGSEFDLGVEAAGAQDILATAAALGLGVVGVSVHLEGTGESEGRNGHKRFGNALRVAAGVINQAVAFGHTISLLDIGGGFSSYGSLQKVNEELNAVLEDDLPGTMLAVIAEPGSYLVSKAFKLATRVHSIRVGAGDVNGVCYISEGIYTAFSGLLAGRSLRSAPHTIGHNPLLKSPRETVRYSIMGPTWDSLDVVVEEAALPASLTAGDWLVFPDMGAYSVDQAGTIPVHYLFPEHLWTTLRESMPFDSCPTFDPEEPLANGTADSVKNNGRAAVQQSEQSQNEGESVAQAPPSFIMNLDCLAISRLVD